MSAGVIPDSPLWKSVATEGFERLVSRPMLCAPPAGVVEDRVGLDGDHCEDGGELSGDAVRSSKKQKVDDKESAETTADFAQGDAGLEGEIPDDEEMSGDVALKQKVDGGESAQICKIVQRSDELYEIAYALQAKTDEAMKHARIVAAEHEDADVHCCVNTSRRRREGRD